ncbi:ABC-F family ATP-binding cassette domain-containing protein [bacterium]|jgi:ATP-binding cassette, subfamily F, member 3|nr:ABC-F family ATP-binding cassette domain-containing protein [bacterium]MBT4495347.1 ABC-F family ATP-binding cassette domain-containing protein [bacterium]MBT4763734.1 ABC-F family ATP-binding cassette domain-containing protein [bacterium]MBT5401104.1 ABC-F family ATP-binding cassette domain-containing protein [bacterium]MBT5942935.1 ABC-F family ATP-binding cassette domain-containing protein [bacterium]
MSEEVILRFNKVDFEYEHKKPILHQASFSIRQGAKFTLMGQNGAGKSTIFSLIKGKLKADSGMISVTGNASIGIANQVISRADYPLTLEEYFAKAFNSIPGDLKSRIAKVMDAVNLEIPFERIIGELSGGQQARILLAYALIQNPDVLLLDEPTNNLDRAGIDHLIGFLLSYSKTVLVISHDADFLNLFTEGVIYLNNFNHETEMYVGDYYSVVDEIKARVDREEKLNAQLEKKIRDRKDKVNFFANKGGKMRQLAKKLKEETKVMEENKVEVRKEDKVIRNFNIPAQDITGTIVNLTKIKIIADHQPIIKKVDIELKRRSRMLIVGPNGIGKSTLLRNLLAQKEDGLIISPDVVVGYYSQDFASLDFDQKVFDSLKEASLNSTDEQVIRSVAAKFLLTSDLMDKLISALSEGQKGLLSLARLVLMKPGLLILDEPTNHINFRHLPIIIEALNSYDGALMMVSHMPEFVEKIEFNQQLDLSKL